MKKVRYLFLFLFYSFSSTAQNSTIIEPLFDYQKCGLANVVSRELSITVIQYDTAGNIADRYSRIEKDNELYRTSTSKEILWTTAFPFFSASDEKKVNGNVIEIKSMLENLNYYLKDLKATTNITTGEIEIEGKLIIHGTTIDGPTTDYELYKLEFEKIGNCILPKRILFCSLDDQSYQKPRIITEIKYLMK
jgi:hypothetical protein